MVARPGTERTNFNAGELNELLYDRTDVKTWYAGAAVMDGFEPVPQGGYKQLPRSRHRAYGGRRLDQVASLALPGVAGVAAPAILGTLDLGTVRAVAGVELDGFFADQALADSLVIAAGAAPGAPTTTFTAPIDVTTDAQRRRFALAPGGPALVRYIEVSCVIAPAPAAAFTLGTLTAYDESFGLVAKVKPFGVTRDKAYAIELCPGHANLYKQGSYVGSTWLPYTEAQIPGVTVTQRFDTMFLWHEDVAPHRVLHKGTGDSEWATDVAPFENIPNADLGGTYTNGVAEEWNVYYSFKLPDYNQIGDSFSVNVNGEDSGGIEVQGAASTMNWAATAAALAVAVNALPSIGGSGVTVTFTAKKGVTEFHLVFGGAVKGDTFVLAGQSLSTVDAAVTVGRRVRGERPGEPIMSPSRGYPGCGVFAQDRLIVGGFKAKSSAYVMSGPGEYFNLNTQIAAASGPILDNLDTDGAERIIAFVLSRHLVVFTDASSRWLTNRTISRTDPRTWAYNTNDGCAPGLPVIESESSLLFVNRLRTMLMAATYSDASQGYDVTSISLLASHLLAGANDIALQKPQEETDSQRLWIPRDDAPMTVGLLIRNQDVTGFVRWSTDGLVKAVCVDATNEVSILVQRLIAGVPRLTYETLEPDLLLDQSIDVALAPAGTAVAGLEPLEGAVVWALADGFVEGPFTVASGAITLPWPAAAVSVGRWPAPRLRTLPLSKVVNNQVVVLQRPARIHTVRLKLLSSTSVAVAANDRPPRDQPLARWGQPTDAPIPPYSGELVIAGISGFTAPGQAEITQIRPGRLQVRSQTVEAKT